MDIEVRDGKIQSIKIEDARDCLNLMAWAVESRRLSSQQAEEWVERIHVPEDLAKDHIAGVMGDVAHQMRKPHHMQDAGAVELMGRLVSALSSDMQNE